MSVADGSKEELLGALRAHIEWELHGAGAGIPEIQSSALPPWPSAAAGDAASSTGAAHSTAGASSTDEVSSTPSSSVTDPSESKLDLAQGAGVQGSPAGDRRALLLAQVEEQVRGCTGCVLAKERKQTVFARGNPGADLVFIGEGPGRDEDRSGIPFVGPAGKLLDKMIMAMGRSEADVYICNVVKCRPPNNRTPLPDEAGACATYLNAQLDIVAPRIIVALGRCAAENLGCVPPSGGGWRGRWGTYRNVPVMPTYHPAFLLRSPEFKRPVWQDLQLVMKKLAGEG